MRSKEPRWRNGRRAAFRTLCLQRHGGSSPLLGTGPAERDNKEFRKLVKNLLKKLPDSEKFGLIDQINRATNSICLNIAEGSNRSSDKDKAHFLNQSVTSLEEVIAGFDLVLDDKYIEQEEMDRLI